MCLIRASALFDAFFRYLHGEEMPLHFLQETGLLMIDDLGTEPVTQNVTVEYLFDLLNRRIEAGRHTVIATNVDDFAGALWRAYFLAHGRRKMLRSTPDGRR